MTENPCTIAFDYTNTTGRFDYEDGGATIIIESGKTYALYPIVSYWDNSVEIPDYDCSGAVWTISPSSLGNFNGSASAVGANVIFTAGTAGQRGKIKVAVGKMWYYEDFKIVESIKVE